MHAVRPRVPCEKATGTAAGLTNGGMTVGVVNVRFFDGVVVNDGMIKAEAACKAIEAIYLLVLCVSYVRPLRVYTSKSLHNRLPSTRRNATHTVQTVHKSDPARPHPITS